MTDINFVIITTLSFIIFFMVISRMENTFEKYPITKLDTIKLNEIRNKKQDCDKELENIQKQLSKQFKRFNVRINEIDMDTYRYIYIHFVSTTYFTGRDDFEVIIEDIGLTSDFLLKINEVFGDYEITDRESTNITIKLK